MESPSLFFVNWSERPAVLTRDFDHAFAVLQPGAPWKQVEEASVAHSPEMTEEEWRDYFETEFGPLDLSKLPLPNSEK